MLNKFRVLCVCQYGHSRSVALARAFHKTQCEAIAIGHQTAPSAITQAGDWADKIITADGYMKKYIPQHMLDKTSNAGIGPDRWSNPYNQELGAFCDNVVDECLRQWVSDRVMQKRYRCVAFDCFGTVFNPEPVKPVINNYVAHVNAQNFSPYEFEPEWYRLDPWPDSKNGIQWIQEKGIPCVALSNGGPRVIEPLSERAGIKWDYIYDPLKHMAYKPKNLDAYTSIQKDMGIQPIHTLMVTANPQFGDVESASQVGMDVIVIRHGFPATIEALARMLVSP